MESNDEMNPPVKAKRAPKAKREEVAHEDAVAAEGGAVKEKKPRAPRQEYGFRRGATIGLTEKEAKFRGQRQEWFERVQAFSGRTVEEFLAENQGVTNRKGNPEPPRGWLRTFVVDGFVTLTGGEEEAQEAQEQAA